MRCLNLIVAALWLGCGNQEPSVAYYRDIAPIVERNCGGCHSQEGSGAYLVGAKEAQRNIHWMLSKIDSGLMPPWVPSPAGVPLRGERYVSFVEKQTLRQWALLGAPLGAQRDYRKQPPKTTRPAEAPSVTARMLQPYVPPPFDPALRDEVRCFLIPVEPGAITAYDWQVEGSHRNIHHIAGYTLSSAQVAAAARLQGADGRPGWGCISGPGVPLLGVLSSGGTGYDAAVVLPAGAGIPAAALVLQVHYNLQPAASATAYQAIPGRAGVDLWYAAGPVRSVEQAYIRAPSELPCPTGLTADPASPCSREYALQHSRVDSPAEARAINDDVLTACGRTLAGYYQQIDFSQRGDHFYVQTACEATIPTAGHVLSVHLHAHTYLVAGGIELQQANGTWLTLLDVKRWRWVWGDQPYFLRDPIPVLAGQRWRIRATFDNGVGNQWSAFGAPGYDGPAPPPLAAPSYHKGGAARGDEMAQGTLQIVPAQAGP